MYSLIRPIAALPSRPAAASSLQIATTPAIATVPGATPSFSPSIFSVLPVSVASHRIAGGDRASSPAPKGIHDMAARPSLPAMRATRPRLSQSSRAFGLRALTPGSRHAAGHTAAAGIALNNRYPAAAFLPAFWGCAGHPRPSAARILADASRATAKPRPGPKSLRVAPGRGAGQ